MSENLRSKSFAGSGVKVGQEAGRETIYFYFLHQREDRGGGEAPPGKEHACCLQKPTGPSYFLLSASGGWVGEDLFC